MRDERYTIFNVQRNNLNCRQIHLTPLVLKKQSMKKGHADDITMTGDE